MMEQLVELEEKLKEELEVQDRSGEDDETNPQVISFRVIGRVENKFDQSNALDQIRSSEARIVLDPLLVDGLKGLEPGQQIMVLFYFHLSDGYDLLQHPRGNRSRPKRGVFALRSPRRPNPIGVTVAELVDIEGNVLTVRGLDAIDGTPVLDLKPA